MLEITVHERSRCVNTAFPDSICALASPFLRVAEEQRNSNGHSPDQKGKRKDTIQF